MKMSRNNKYIKEVLNKIKEDVLNIIPFNLNDKNVVIFDFTKKNEELKNIDIVDTERFTDYIFSKLKQNNTPVGIGKYNEDRIIYARSPLFKVEGGYRTVHLGIDIWAKEGTPILAPITGVVHSFKNNSKFGDYGPTIILEHHIENVRFYTLYGHLNLESIQNLKKWQKFDRGNQIARIGSHLINGSWPPHLHFQIITDMQGLEGDFPAVATIKDRKRFLDLCPDPNLILKIKKLI